MASRSSMLFKDVNVFLSRSLVPPELFDAVHDALRLNGANLFLCCDPSRNSPNDFHVISSPDHVRLLSYPSFKIFFSSKISKFLDLGTPHSPIYFVSSRRSLKISRPRAATCSVSTQFLNFSIRVAFYCSGFNFLNSSYLKIWRELIFVIFCYAFGCTSICQFGFVFR